MSNKLVERYVEVQVRARKALKDLQDDIDDTLLLADGVAGFSDQLAHVAWNAERLLTLVAELRRLEKEGRGD